MIVAKAGQYPDSLYDFGHAPGVSGGAIGAGTKLAAKYGYRGAKYLARRFLFPKKYTYSGATGRGIGVGTLIASQLSGEVDDLNGIPGTPTGKTPYKKQQRNYRQRRVYCRRRRDNRHNNCRQC